MLDPHIILAHIRRYQKFHWGEGVWVSLGMMAVFQLGYRAEAEAAAWGVNCSQQWGFMQACSPAAVLATACETSAGVRRGGVGRAHSSAGPRLRSSGLLLGGLEGKGSGDKGVHGVDV